MKLTCFSIFQFLTGMTTRPSLRETGPSSSAWARPSGWARQSSLASGEMFDRIDQSEDSILVMLLVYCPLIGQTVFTGIRCEIFNRIDQSEDSILVMWLVYCPLIGQTVFIGSRCEIFYRIDQSEDSILVIWSVYCPLIGQTVFTGIRWGQLELRMIFCNRLFLCQLSNKHWLITLLFSGFGHPFFSFFSNETTAYFTHSQMN